MRIGIVLKNAREDSGLSIEEVSKLIQIDPNTVRTIEAGKFLPTFRLLIKFGDLFKWDEITLINQWNNVEKERNFIKENPRFPNLIKKLNDCNISQRRFAREIGRSPEYVRTRLAPFSTANFEINDLVKSMALFNISAEEATILFQTRDEDVEKGDESNGEGK